MDQNSQAPVNMTELIRLAQSPAGQQLLALLQQNGGQQLQQAVDLASTGDYSQAKQALSALMASPEVQKLLKQMGGTP